MYLSRHIYKIISQYINQKHIFELELLDKTSCQFYFLSNNMNMYFYDSYVVLLGEKITIKLLWKNILNMKNTLNI
jgi:uncharacterized protein (DUF2164 family)